MNFSKSNKLFRAGNTLPLLVAMIGGTSAPAYAFEFKSGDLTGSIDSTVSWGISKRIEDRDPALIGAGNGGTSAVATSTTDDGNLNFDNGDVFSHIIKGNHDISLNYNNFGAFTRVKWWNDIGLADQKVPHGHEPTSATPNQKLDDSGFHNLAQFSGIEVLDAFVFGSFELGDKPLDVRLGKQVVSWGESTFIQNGINVINPVDVSSFRRPGAEIKEGLLPVNMLYASLGATDSINMEFFYQLDWEKTVVDGCGTYFSGADFVADGCDRLTYVSAIPDQTNYLANYFVVRNPDREARDDGQYGLALRNYSESMDTEFGLYYLNYHSRLPYISGVKTSDGLPHAYPGGANDAHYIMDYPEDIKLLGLSFATTVGDVAISGEISYRPDYPVQINGNEILGAALAGTATTFLPKWNAAANGSIIEGYDKYDYTQIQATFVKFVDRVMGASRLTLLGEVGAGFTPGLAKLSERRYGRSPVFGLGGATSTEGYVTRAAWGYRALAKWDYTNLFGGVSMSPKITFKHDVKGTSPTSDFQEGRKALGLGVDFSYKDSYKFGASLTKFLDSDFDTSRDRDFVSLTASASF